MLSSKRFFTTGDRFPWPYCTEIFLLGDVLHRGVAKVRSVEEQGVKGGVKEGMIVMVSRLRDKGAVFRTQLESYVCRATDPLQSVTGSWSWVSRYAPHVGLVAFA